MKKESQIKSFILTGGQTLFLLAVFVFAGLLMPIQMAPAVWNRLPAALSTDTKRSEMFFEIVNRNVSSGEKITVSVSSPKSAAQIRHFSYKCVSSQVELAYPKTNKIKKLPCSTKIRLPRKSSHNFIVLTSRENPAYVPLTVSVVQEEASRKISVMIAAGQRADTASHLSDRQGGILR